MNPNTIAYVIVAAVAVASAVGVIAFQSPIRSALSLVLNFTALGVLYFMMNLDLIGISQVLVYTGLIMMLFLFCILLLNLGAPRMLQEKSYIKWWGAVLAIGILGVIVFSQVVGPLAWSVQPTAPHDFGTAKAIGQTLFTNYVYGFEIASVLLLVGIVGSILLAKRRGA
jgi:NADH-quinone oxidoreductase subunit J